MHKLQQHILKQLILNPTQRYSELKPAGVEGNLFMYHLRQLQREGMVNKNKVGSYELTPAGQLYADKLSLKTFTRREQPKIVTLLAIQNAKDEWLLYRRKRQPLIGYAGFPYGKYHSGETIMDAAKRELAEKTGLTAELTHRGDGYITIYQGGEPVSEIIFHLFYGDGPRGRLKPASSVGQSFWTKLEDVSKSELLPSVVDLVQVISENQNNRFFRELVYYI